MIIIIKIITSTTRGPLRPAAAAGLGHGPERRAERGELRNILLLLLVLLLSLLLFVLLLVLYIYIYIHTHVYIYIYIYV